MPSVLSRLGISSSLTITSLTFGGFVLVVLLLYYMLPKRQNLLLLLASYLFYITWEWRFALVLLIVTFINYFIAFALEYSQREKSIKAKWFLGIGVTLNLATLSYYKYLSYLIARFETIIPALKTRFNVLEIVLPVGLSFFILQSLSYLLDVYQGQMQPTHDPLNFALFMAYFPKLLAGPIERARVFLPQLTKPKIVDNQIIAESTARIVVGLVRKLAIADVIFTSIPKAFFNDPAKFYAPDLLFWWLAFLFAIYNDFAGYTSIVRGVSGLFGIELSENFRQPLFSTSFLDLWYRWHATLSVWLREYIFLPLSRALLRRNPSGKYLPNVVVPILLTLLASGLWHGIDSHFLLWGLLTGVVLVLERIIKLRKPKKPVVREKAHNLGVAIYGLGLMWLISLFVGPPFLFNIRKTFQFWSHLFVWNPAIRMGLNFTIKPIFAILISFAIDYGQFRVSDDVFFTKWPLWARSLILALAIIILFLATRAAVDMPFIYQEF